MGHVEQCAAAADLGGLRRKAGTASWRDSMASSIISSMSSMPVSRRSVRCDARDQYLCRAGYRGSW